MTHTLAGSQKTTGTRVLNLHRNHLHVSAPEVLAEDVLGRPVLQAIVVVPIVRRRGLGAQADVRVLLSKVAVLGFQTHCCWRRERMKDEKAT